MKNKDNEDQIMRLKKMLSGSSKQKQKEINKRIAKLRSRS